MEDLKIDVKAKNEKRQGKRKKEREKRVEWKSYK